MTDQASADVWKCPRCGSSETWFDRTIPMATICCGCGRDISGKDDEPMKTNDDQAAADREAVIKAVLKKCYAGPDEVADAAISALAARGISRSLIDAHERRSDAVDKELDIARAEIARLRADYAAISDKMEEWARVAGRHAAEEHRLRAALERIELEAVQPDPDYASRMCHVLAREALEGKSAP